MCSIKPRSRKMYHCDHSRQTRIVSAHNLQVERLIIVEIQIVIKFMFSTLDNIIKLTDLLSHDLLCPYPKSRKYQRKEDKTCKNKKNFSLLICAYFAIFELICLLEKHEVTRFRTDLQKKISKKQSLYKNQTNKQTGMSNMLTDRQSGNTSYCPLCPEGRIYTHILGVLLPSILLPCLWQAVKQQVCEFLGCGWSKLLTTALQSLP